VQDSYDHVTRTLPGPVDKLNMHIVVNTNRRDLSKVSTNVVNMSRVKRVVERFIRLGNPWYRNITVDENADLQRLFVANDIGW